MLSQDLFNQCGAGTRKAQNEQRLRRRDFLLRTRQQRQALAGEELL